MENKVTILNWRHIFQKSNKLPLFPDNFLVTETHGAEEDKDFRPFLVKGKREYKLLSPMKISRSLN